MLHYNLILFHDNSNSLLKIEGKICLAKIVQNFDFKLDPDQNFGAVQQATINPADGTKVTLKIRD